MKKTLLIIVCLLFFAVLANAQVSRTVNVPTAGTLNTLLSFAEKATLTNLTVTGYIDTRDVKCLRDEITNLNVLDLSTVTIQAYNGSGGTSSSTSYPANELPENSFSNNSSLRTVILPGSINSIGIQAFYSCAGLTGITFPEYVTNIGDEAFYYCPNLNGSLTITNSVATIGNNAFWGCNSLQSLIIGNSVTSIGKSAFARCYNLNVINSLNNTPPIIESRCFDVTPVVIVPATAVSKYRSTAVWMDFTIVGEKKISIYNPSAGDLAMAIIESGNGPLSSITHLAVTGKLDSSDISQMKTNMAVLTEIDLSGATLEQDALSDNAFKGKATLTSFLFPAIIDKLGNYAFNGTALKGSLNLPSSLKTIGNNAFNGCGSLTGSLIIPESVTSIGDGAFWGCHSLTGSLIIPNSVTSIGSGAFYYCIGLTGSLAISNSITSIPDDAFGMCRGLSDTLTIPASVTGIGGYAFNGCSSLSMLYINTGTSTINDYAFNDCPKLQKISITRAIPPTIFTNTFAGVNKTNCVLEVPIGASVSYQIADYWGQFSLVKGVSMTDTFGITVQVGSGGTLKNNNVTLGNGSVITVKMDSTLSFSIAPEVGYEIAAFTYNGTDVKSQLINNQYTTPAVNANAVIRITFQKVQYRISITSAESGYVNLICEYGTTPSFDFTPSNGWQIHSVTYNGTDVTDSMIDGIYTAPAIAENALLNVSFELGISLQTVSTSQVKVYTIESDIVVDGTSQGEIIKLYTLSGVELTTIQSQGDRINIPVQKGAVYLLKTASKTVKVTL